MRPAKATLVLHFWPMILRPSKAVGPVVGLSGAERLVEGKIDANDQRCDKPARLISKLTT